MADETDVENVLVGLITGALYPNGTGAACAAGVPCKVFRGWPTVTAQEAAKAGNYVNVSVAARNGVERSTARYPFVWQTSVAPVHTISATVNNNVITLSGTIAVPQNFIVIVGNSSGNNKVFKYAVQSTDTLSTIAAAMANLINANFAGTVSNGATITIASGAQVQARIASSGTSVQEVGRQEKAFQISIWAPPCTDKTQDADNWRNAVAKIIDPAIRQLVRITMPDQFYAHIHYERTITKDAAEMQGLYRRDLYYWVEYAVTISQTSYEIGAFQDQLTAIPDGANTTDVTEVITNS